MMTIKEMQKLYKKVAKFEDMYDSARVALSTASIFEYEKHLAQALIISKAVKGLKKIALLMGVTLEDMMIKTGSEETFVRWMLLEGIEMVNAGDDSDEETEEENDE